MEAKNVGVWIRVSTDDQAKGDSPEHHEKRARAYAESKGWNVVDVYHLEGVSGKAVMHHSEAKRMMEAIKKGTITGLIFSKLARVARNTRELLDIADYFRVYSADFISLQESIDTSSPAGRLFYTMIAAMAQWEREEISDRVAASVPIRAKLGKPLGGQASFGYKWDGHNLILDEKEAPVRKLVYELFLKNKRKKTTAKALNEMGYRTRNGSMFSDTTVDRLLRDPSAKGERRANYTKSLGDGKAWELKPQKDWVISACPVIVSEEIWNQCNAILDEQTKKMGPRAVHLFAGYIFCSICGGKMYVHHNNLTPTYTCSPCKNRIAVTDIEEIYHEQLKAFLLTETEISNYLQQSDSLIQEKEKLYNILKKEADNIKKEMDRLVDMRVQNELTKEKFTTHYQPKADRFDQIEDQLPEVEAEIDFLKIQHLSSDSVLRDAKDLYERWPSLPLEEKRAIVETITNEIRVGNGDIAFSLAYIPTASLNSGTRQHNFRVVLMQLGNKKFGLI